MQGDPGLIPGDPYRVASCWLLLVVTKATEAVTEVVCSAVPGRVSPLLSAVAGVNR